MLPTHKSYISEKICVNTEMPEGQSSLQFGATTWRVEPPRFRGGLLQEQNTAYADLFTSHGSRKPHNWGAAPRALLSQGCVLFLSH